LRFLERDFHLVDEIVSRFRRVGFFDVRANGCARTKDLISQRKPGGGARQTIDHLDDSYTKAKRSFANILPPGRTQSHPPSFGSLAHQLWLIGSLILAHWLIGSLAH
jgi:hypothetical protein